MPPEEAGGGKPGAQPAESPTPETKADAATEGPKGEPGEPGEQAENGNGSFDTRTEWKAIDDALGKETARKVRPIVRKLMESEHHARERVKALEPMANLASEFRALAGDEKGWDTMQRIIRGYVTDPAASVPILEMMLSDAKQRGGLEVTSPDLQAALKRIDTQLEEGQISPEAADEFRGILRETEKARKAASRAETQRTTTETGTREARVIEAVNAWESNVRSRFPDFGDVTPTDDARHGESIADRVFDSLRLLRMSQPGATADDLIREADRVLKLAVRQVAPPVRTSRVVTSGGSPGTAKPRPKTLREAMDNVQLE